MSKYHYIFYVVVYTLQNCDDTAYGSMRYGPSRFRKRAEEVLDDLVEAGRAERCPQSGRRADKYTLCDCDDCDT